jgi:hypothetical protein
LNQTIHGSFRESQRLLNLKLQQRDLSRALRAAATLNQFLDQWPAIRNPAGAWCRVIGFSWPQ